jgi:transmembrane sensor
LPTQVSAGEEVRIAHGAAIKRMSLNVPEAAAAWRGHRLWFDNATLAEVAAEFNRYNARKIQVGSDPALLKKRYTATFDAYDPESFVEALRDDPALVVESNDEHMVIQAR